MTAVGKKIVLHEGYGPTAPYFVITREFDGQVYDVDANDGSFEAIVDASWATYDVTLTQQGTSSTVWIADLPSALPAGRYILGFYDNLGTPAVGDSIIDPMSGPWVIAYDGVRIVSDLTYWADIEVVRDGTSDEYTVAFIRNSQKVKHSTGTPQVQVVKRSDGADLVAATNMSEIASLGVWKKDEATNVMQDGESYIVIITATVDGLAMTFTRLLSKLE